MADDKALGGTLLRKRAGGASAARVLSFRDFTGLEMMRVLREAVDLRPGIETWNRCPAVELLSDDYGACVGAVIYNMEWRTFVLVRAPSVILATGGSGRLHLTVSRPRTITAPPPMGRCSPTGSARGCARWTVFSTTRPASPIPLTLPAA